MPLLYKPVQSNMPSKNGKKKWYPHIVKFKTRADTDTLAREVAQKCSVTEGDVYNVLINLMESMSYHLLHSQSVHLKGLGTFTVKAQSEGNGVDTPEEVNPGQINYLKIQFTPSFEIVPGVGKVCPMLRNVTYEKYKGK